MARQAYKLTLLVLVDGDQAVANENRDQGEGPPSQQEVMDFLLDALELDVNLEENNDYVGFLSAEVIYDDMRPLTGDEMITLYGPDIGPDAEEKEND